MPRAACTADPPCRPRRARTPEAAARPAAQRGARGRRARVQLDVDRGAHAATQLPNPAIRALLQDRAPLLRPARAGASALAAAPPAAGPFYAVRAGRAGARSCAADRGVCCASHRGHLSGHVACMGSAQTSLGTPISRAPAPWSDW